MCGCEVLKTRQYAHSSGQKILQPIVWEKKVHDLIAWTIVGAGQG